MIFFFEFLRKLEDCDRDLAEPFLSLLGSQSWGEQPAIPLGLVRASKTLRDCEALCALTVANCRYVFERHMLSSAWLSVYARHVSVLQL
jgi:hypothetical protein